LRYGSVVYKNSYLARLTEGANGWTAANPGQAISLQCRGAQFWLILSLMGKHPNFFTVNCVEMQATATDVPVCHLDLLCEQEAHSMLPLQNYFELLFTHLYWRL